MLRYTQQTVLSKKNWLTDKLLSVTVTRDADFSFLPGQFARLGLTVTQPESASLKTASAPNAEPNEWRAYSMVSRPDADELEFYSVIVPNGKFSPAFAQLKVGDALWVDKSVFGFLTLERFVEGEDLWLMATGTGLSAYLSMLRDTTTWTRFKRIILLHGVRNASELAYRDELIALAQRSHNGLAQFNNGLAQFIYLPVTSQVPLTAELSPSIQPPWLAAARLTTLLTSGELEQRVGVALDPTQSRVMLCGNPAMVTDMRGLLSERGFVPGRRGVAGNLAVENYW